MHKAVIVFAGLIAMTMAAGPTTSYVENFVCQEEGEKVVDAQNMCWYHVCVQGESGLGLVPKRCALGSKVSYNFVTGKSNPCTINFDDVIGYNCDRARESLSGPPPCHDGNTCENGGTPVYESNICWCECPASWTSWKCELPVVDVRGLDLPPASNICVDGAPLEDWCASSPCLNGGKCMNQCDTFWCDCPDHFNNDYTGKRCEL